MPDTLQAWEVRTEPLGVDQLQARVPEIQSLLQTWRFDRVTATLGYGCKAPSDQLWHPVSLKVARLAAFVVDNVRDGTFQLGECDLHIEDEESTLEFRLCHESDVHFESESRDRVDQVIAVWRDAGLMLYLSTGPKNSALPKTWTRIGPATA